VMAAAEPLPAAQLGPFTAAQIDCAREAWPMRAAEELRSALVYRALASAGRRAGLPGSWVARFEEVVKEELGHARLCATVGARLGASSPRYDAGPLRPRLAALPDPALRAVSLLLIEVAVGETISMSLFRAARREATEPLTRWVLGSILRDEARHERLGWDALAALWGAMPDPVRRYLQLEATRGLGGLEKQIALPALRRLEAGHPVDPAHGALGVLAPESRVEAFYLAIESLVLTRLTRLGLDGEQAWRDRHRARGQGDPARH
jgi:hypothetical protein